MKNVVLVVVILLTTWLGQQVYAQQGFGTNTPDRSAAVDIVSSKRGLLIPRVALTALNNPSPITNPANSLFVFNTTSNSEVTPGYYYWEDNGTQTGVGKWVRFVSSDDVKTTKVMEGTNVKVDSTTVDGTTTYQVSVKGGDTDGKVLVTRVDNSDPGNPVTTTEWVDPAEFVNDVIEGVNGITTTLNTTSNKVEVGLGGALTEAATTITTNGATNTLAIDGLEDVTSTFQDDADGFVMVLTTGGVLQKTKLTSLVNANNGLTVNDGSANAADKGKVQLGGALVQPTTITADATNTLAVDGLQATNEANKIVVAADAGGVLQTVTRSLSAVVTGNMAINPTTVPGYSSYVQEVNITATLGASDWTVTLPDADVANSGQVINVKILNTTDAHDGYLNIIDNTGTLAYGALPYQGWVLKSNGTNWLIVGRN